MPIIVAMDQPMRPALDADAAYRALLARDARLDGRLFVGVTSTGVYCRPICRVRTPRRENCRFFDTPAQAEAAAFRPCLKCRPEIAPGPGLAWSVMDASRTLARQAAQWLAAHAHGADEDGVEPRRARAPSRRERLPPAAHLAAEHGVTPLQYADAPPVARQAVADRHGCPSAGGARSGFRSLRRFNAAFAANYRLSPTTARRRGGVPGTDERLRDLSPFASRSPARSCCASQRAIPGVEHTPCACGARCGGVSARGRLGRGVVRAAAPAADVALFGPLMAASGSLLPSVRRWLDLDADPQAMAATLRGLPGSGLRLPGGVDAFELGVRAVLGQQVTVAAARTLARRVVERFGTPLATPWSELDRCFPAPDRLAGAGVAALAELGIIRSRAAAIVARAGLVGAAADAAGGCAGAPLIERQCTLPGIGVDGALRRDARLGWTDAFPPGDVAVLNALGLPRGSRAEREADALSQAWRPWRSYAVLKLWNSLETRP
jgi:AraC family transcriptional regulator of adaptative response / DNA-3-methyladenine glycosylase II